MSKSIYTGQINPYVCMDPVGQYYDVVNFLQTDNHTYNQGKFGGGIPGQLFATFVETCDIKDAMDGLTALAGCGKMRPIEVDFPGLLRYHLIKSPRNFEVAIDAIQG